MGYHIITFGMYADALVQIVDPKGRTSADVFLEDIAKPFGLYEHHVFVFLDL